MVSQMLDIGLGALGTSEYVLITGALGSPE